MTAHKNLYLGWRLKTTKIIYYQLYGPYSYSLFQAKVLLKHHKKICSLDPAFQACKKQLQHYPFIQNVSHLDQVLYSFASFNSIESKYKKQLPNYRCTWQSGINSLIKWCSRIIYSIVKISSWWCQTSMVKTSSRWIDYCTKVTVI